MLVIILSEDITNGAKGARRTSLSRDLFVGKCLPAWNLSHDLKNFLRECSHVRKSEN